MLGAIQSPSWQKDSLTEKLLFTTCSIGKLDYNLSISDVGTKTI